MQHTISVLCENQFGAFNRIVTMFSGKGFNVRSMSIGETENPEVSRMTIVTEGDDKIIEQVVKQLNRLIDTIKIIDLTKHSAMIENKRNPTIISNGLWSGLPFNHVQMTDRFSFVFNCFSSSMTILFLFVILLAQYQYSN